MRKEICCASAVAAMMTLASCAGVGQSQSDKRVEVYDVPAISDPATVLLLDKSEDITQLLKELTSLERSRQMAPEISKNPASLLKKDDPLAHPVTLEWNGEARVVVKRVADVAGWRFVVKGSAPFSAQVRLKVVDTPLINVLEDISSQLGNQADLGVDKPMKTIELIIRG